MKRNIGLVGKMHDGKSTVATILAEDYGYAIFSFSTPVRELWDKAAVQVIDPYLRDITGKVIVPTKAMNRPGYQLVGARGRAYDPDIWLKRMNLRFTKGAMGIVIDDMRYQNEATWARVRDFCLVRVSRPWENRELSIMQSYIQDYGRQPKEWELLAIYNHESEIEVDDIPVELTITNDGNIDNLREQVKLIMEDI